MKGGVGDSRKKRKEKINIQENSEVTDSERWCGNVRQHQKFICDYQFKVKLILIPHLLNHLPGTMIN